MRISCRCDLEGRFVFIFFISSSLLKIMLGARRSAHLAELHCCRVCQKASSSNEAALCEFHCGGSRGSSRQAPTAQDAEAAVIVIDPEQEVIESFPLIDMLSKCPRNLQCV